MLVLSRQRDETIMIGDDVQITVVDIRGDKVRLGISAPREIQVHRKEVYDAIKRENQRASKMAPGDLADVVGKDDKTKRAQSDSPTPDRENRSASQAKPITTKDGVPEENGTRSDADRSKSSDGAK